MENHTLDKAYRQYLIIAAAGLMGTIGAIYYLTKKNIAGAAVLGVPGVAMLIGGGKFAMNTKSLIDATSGSFGLKWASQQLEGKKGLSTQLPIRHTGRILSSSRSVGSPLTVQKKKA